MGAGTAGGVSSGSGHTDRLRDIGAGCGDIVGDPAQQQGPGPDAF